MLLDTLYNRGIIKANEWPHWLRANTQRLVIMGSVAYGVSRDNSDLDIYGVVIPPITTVFPHLAGEIPGFGRQKKHFEQWQLHHVKDVDRKIEYDFQIFNIVKYFTLLMENNPNALDSLFVPHDCVLHTTAVGNMIYDNRHLFLHKGAFHKFKGYAYSQQKKIKTKNHKGLDDLKQWEAEHGVPHTTTFAEVEEAIAKRAKGSKLLSQLTAAQLTDYRARYKAMLAEGKRSETVKIYNFDCKFGYHVVRLLAQCEQILTERDMDLRRNREHLKAIRRGDVTESQIEEYFAEKLPELERLYESSTIPHKPNEEAIRQLLMDCLEHHFGSLTHIVPTQDRASVVLDKIGKLVDEYRALTTSTNDETNP